jgi:hypothetical protein
MPTTSFLRSPLAVAAALAVVPTLFAHAPAEAQTPPPAARNRKRACVEAYESAQQLRNAGKLTESRERLLVCSNEECPTAVRGDCATWLGEVESNLPSVVIEARLASGQETPDVNVWLDGQPFAKGLDGRALTLDPGVHTFRFESPSAGQIEQRVIIRQGEKNRKIVAQFGPEGGAPGPSAAPPPAPKPKPSLEAEEGGSALYPTLPIVLTGVGVVGLGAFTAFALSGKNLEGKLRDSGCEPNCSGPRVDRVERLYLYADISLVAGLASLAGGAVTYFLLRDDKAPPSGARLQVNVGAAPGGGFAGLSGRF